MSGLLERTRVAAAVFVVAAGGVILWGVQQDRARVVGDLDDANDQIDELTSAVDTLTGQVQGMGGDPAVEVEHSDEGPEPVPTPPEDRGPGPTDEQVDDAVERYCILNGCIGPRGPAPTPMQVAAAVVSYCDARGSCRGLPGESIEGPTGPPPTTEQIAAVVNTYCTAHDGCRGPSGLPGPACPGGLEPVPWTLDEPQARLIGLAPGSYLVCRAG